MNEVLVRIMVTNLMNDHEHKLNIIDWSFLAPILKVKIEDTEDGSIDVYEVEMTFKGVAKNAEVSDFSVHEEAWRDPQCGCERSPDAKRGTICPIHKPKLTNEEFYLFNEKLRANLIANKEWRAGQGMVNTLFEMRPDLAGMITATDNDPFYLNRKIGNFFRFICTQEQLAKVNPQFLK